MLYSLPPSASLFVLFWGILLTVCVFAFLVGVVTYLPILPQSVTHFSPESGGCL